MEKSKGKFEKGKWVEEEESPAAGDDSRRDPMEERISQVADEVTGSLNRLMNLARDLVATPEGRVHIQKRIDQAGERIDASIEEIKKNLAGPEKKKK